MFSIQVQDLHWLNNDEHDLCLHGHVKVCIGNEIFEYDATVSATALYLLKSMTQDHHMNQEIQMLPCCGHTMIANQKLNTVDIIGCPQGIDWTVVHQDNYIKIITETFQEVILIQKEYQNIVFSFVDQIEDFYYQSQPRLLPKENDERQAYIAFWNEWYRLRYQYHQKTYPIEFNQSDDYQRRQYLWKKLDMTMDKRLPYWYPLYDIKPEIPVIAFYDDVFQQNHLWEYIQEYFIKHQIELVFEIQEVTPIRIVDYFGSCYFIEQDEDSYDMLGMSESFWYDVSHEWLIYVSHEGTIAFAGKDLVSYIRKNKQLIENELLTG